MPLATFRTAIDTPGMTALCVSVMVPWSVAVDCAMARDGPAASSARTSGTIPKTRTGCVRLIFHLSNNNAVQKVAIIAFADMRDCYTPKKRRGPDGRAQFFEPKFYP